MLFRTTFCVETLLFKFKKGEANVFLLREIKFLCPVFKRMPYGSGAQTVARKALWSDPRSNFHWKENLALQSFKRIF